MLIFSVSFQFYRMIPRGNPRATLPPHTPTNKNNIKHRQGCGTQFLHVFVSGGAPFRSECKRTPFFSRAHFLLRKSSFGAFNEVEILKCVVGRLRCLSCGSSCVQGLFSLANVFPPRYFGYSDFYMLSFFLNFFYVFCVLNMRKLCNLFLRQ